MSAAAIKTLKLGKMVRSYALDRAAIDTDKRTVRVQFSSEQPVQRWFGEEILDHSAESVDLSRATAGCAVLLEHDTAQRVGITETANITANKTGEAVIRFSKSAKGEEAFQEVQDGTLRWISVGYRINRMKQEGDVDPKNPDEMATYRATSWEPLEISLVAIPADTTARVLGRGENAEEREITIENFNQRKTMSEPITPAPVAPAPAAPIVAPAVVRSEAELAKEWQSRAKEIFAIGKEFKRTTEASDAIAAGLTVDQFRKQVLESIKDGGKSKDEEITSERSLPAGKTPGDVFIESEQFRAIRDKYNRSGKIPSGLNVSFEVPYVSQRATLTGTGLTSIEKESGVILLNQQPVTLEAVIPSIPTDKLTVRYTEESAYTNASTALAEEGEYQEATFSLQEVDATVRKVGVLGKITDEQLADQDYMRDYVNNRLRFMVDSRVDNHILNGTGTSNQIKGILEFSGIQTQAQGANTAPDAIHKGLTKVRTVGFYEPDLVVMHPSDWEGIALMKDANGQYLFGGPARAAAPMIWGLPILTTTAIASGSCLVGAFRLGAATRPKTGLSVETTNSNGDDFKYGRVSIRADRRLALCCYRPLAFCEVTGLS